MVLLFFSRGKTFLEGTSSKYIKCISLQRNCKTHGRPVLNSQSFRDFDISDTAIHVQANSSMRKVENFFLKLSC